MTRRNYRLLLCGAGAAAGLAALLGSPIPLAAAAMLGLAVVAHRQRL